MRAGSFRLGLLVGAVVGIVLVLGLMYATGRLDEDLSAVDEARAVLDQSYWKPVDSEALEEASIRAMVDELRREYGDRFSHYFSPEELKAFRVSSSGRFSGVGVTVTEVSMGLRVAAVIPDSPAEAAGIEEGELIIAVDGRSIAGTSSEVATTRIMGPEGTSVELRVIDPEDGETRKLAVDRAEVRLPAVSGELREVDGRKVAYVRLSTFSGGAHGELRLEIDRLNRQGAEGLVLDLRGNGGGLLREAISCASVFVEEGEPVVSTQSRSSGDEVLRAEGDPVDPKPTVVLIDGDTASASEILTAALEAYDLATTVGKTTYGKGVFQQVIDLPSGGALDITVGEYLTADGASLAGKGITPDVDAADDPDTKPDEALDEGLEVLGREL